ncbi:PREDICTED: kinesin-like protein KIF27 [Cyprinodon variegatus]|uniref:kinesin-like protein KIF27 n=1 Tax=Cyprinodon variegatus TaxID=28743 RepID=UPI000742A4C1|nr:PREDICTED: kinesin-like protein KIF27 [Cyprinodon variegatus]
MSDVYNRVAVRIRPLLSRELLHHHQECVRVVPQGSGQVMLGSDRLFSFDHAFGPTASQDEVYESCVQPLVESLLGGFNATVFCYGQTGSGKTYTLGGGSQDEGGIIDRVAQDVFLLLAKQKNNDGIKAVVRVSYLELYREELRDLLDINTNFKELHIREDEKGNTVVVGATEMAVTSPEELLDAVQMGNALRHTCATSMNEHSSKDMEEMEKEKTSGGDGLKQVSVPVLDERLKQDTAAQYLLLTREAATLLAEISEASPTDLFRQKLQDWQERLAAVGQSHPADNSSEGIGDQTLNLTHSELREELYKCQKTLKEKEYILEQKEEELRQVQKEVEKLLEEKQLQLLALEKEKKASQIQREQLLNKQTEIDRLHSDLMDVHGTSPGTAGEARPSGCSCARPHCVPITGHSSLHKQSRKIHSSPPACSLERVMAAFKMRGRLLLAEMEEKDEIYCPFRTQWRESQEITQNNYEEEKTMGMERSVSKEEFRHPLNLTWTNWEKNPLLKPQSSGLKQSNGNTAVQESVQDKDTKENQTKEVRRTINAERRIHALTINIRMKEDLIKELEKTARETQTVGAAEGDVLKRLSIQSQQIRAEVYHSLQSMRRERAKLQSSLRELGETVDSNKKLQQNKGQSPKSSNNPKGFHQEASDRVLLDTSWLEKEEEQVIQQRAELQELEEELERKEEILQHREEILQLKNRLQVKVLQSSQALSQDLLHVSVELESVEEQLKGKSSIRKTEGVTIRELEKDRDMLKMKRDTLEAQLRDNRVLTMEEEHSLLQLQEAVEALDAVLEFKSNSIQDRQKHLLVRNSHLYESKGSEPAQLCEISRKLKELSLPEATELLMKYFNKVVSLREAERHLRLQCEELELQAGEQEAAMKEMGAAMQRLALDTDRRLTQQHRDHQNNIQLLLQKLKEEASREVPQSIQDRIHHLEKELFFYKSSSRQLKKKLKELLNDSPYTDNQYQHNQESTQRQDILTPLSVENPKANCGEEGKMTHILSTYTKISTEQAEAKALTSSPSVIQASPKRKTSEHSHSHERSSRGQSEKSLELTPVRLCRRDLREIPSADLQLRSSATKWCHSDANSSCESMMEDSIEVPRKM